jgi:hypothetical protein
LLFAILRKRLETCTPTSVGTGEVKIAVFKFQKIIIIKINLGKKDIEKLL